MSKTVSHAESSMAKARATAAAVGVGGDLANIATMGIGIGQKRVATNSSGKTLAELKRQRQMYDTHRDEAGNALYPPDEIPEGKPDQDLSKNSSYNGKDKSQSKTGLYAEPNFNKGDLEKLEADLAGSSKKKMPKFDGTDGNLDLGLPSYNQKDELARQRAINKSIRDDLYTQAWTGEDNKTRVQGRERQISGGTLGKKSSKNEGTGIKTRTKIQFHKKNLKI